MSGVPRQRPSPRVVQMQRVMHTVITRINECVRQRQHINEYDMQCFVRCYMNGVYPSQTRRIYQHGVFWNGYTQALTMQQWRHMDASFERDMSVYLQQRFREEGRVVYPNLF